MVADQFALNPIEVLDKEPDFRKDLFIAEGLKLPLFHPVVETGPGPHLKGPQPDEIGMDLVQDMGRFHSMLSRPAISAEAGDLNAGGWQIASANITAAIEDKDQSPVSMNATLNKEAVQSECTLEGCKAEEIGPVTIPSIGVEGGF